MELLIKNATVLDAETNNKSLDIWIDGDVIKAVGEHLSAPGVKELDFTGKTVLPGFIDSHIHVVARNQPREEMLRAYAMNGVAAIRDLGILGNMELEPYLAWLNEHKGCEYAQVVTAGRYIDIRGGYGMGPDPSLMWGIEITSQEEAREKVAYEIDRGVDGIKIGLQDGALGPVGNKMSPKFISAIVKEAHSRGVWTTAHIGKVEDLQTVVDCGIDSAAHTPKNAVMPDALIEQMVSNGIPMTSTVGDPVSHVASMPMIPPVFHSKEEFLNKCLADRDNVLENLKRFYHAGGLILAATDRIRLENAEEEAIIPTIELRYMTQIGMTWQEAIATATINNAKACRIDDLGLVKSGMRACLVAIQGSLDSDFKALEHPAFVMNRGVILKNEFNKV